MTPELEKQMIKVAKKGDLANACAALLVASTAVQPSLP